VLGLANGDSLVLGRLVSPSRVVALTIAHLVLLIYYCVSKRSDLKVGGSCWHDVSSGGRTLLPLCNWTLYTTF
jgi:hypothetical protein